MRSERPNCGALVSHVREVRPTNGFADARKFRALQADHWPAHPGTCLALQGSVSVCRRDAWRGGLVLLAVFLTLGTSLCLFDQDAGHHEGTALDLCVLMVVVLSIAPLLLVRPLLSGRADAYLPLALTNAPVRTLDPPPKRSR
jgi:hypothetical protein